MSANSNDVETLDVSHRVYSDQPMFWLRSRGHSDKDFIAGRHQSDDALH